MKVFLGGTYKDSWRQELSQWIVCKYIDPTIIEFNPSDRMSPMPQVLKETKQKKECGILLHLFTHKTKGHLEIVSATIDVVNNPAQTIIVIMDDNDWEREQRVSLTEFAVFAKMNGCKVIVGSDREKTLKEVALHINNTVDRTKVEMTDNWR